MQIKLHPALLGVLFMGLLLIFFLLIRGCQHSRNQQQQLAHQDAALAQLQADTARLADVSRVNKENYDNSMEYANGIIALRENQRDATEMKLLATTFDYAALKRKYEQVKADPDTSATFVPNDFIKDCHECFNELEHKQHLIKLYVSHVDSLDAEIARKDRLNINRLRELTQERDAYRQKSEAAIEIAGKTQALAQPRRKVLLSIGALWQPMPKAVGAGLIYQDKRGRQFGARAYVSSWGTLYESEANFPFSFKR